MASFWNTFLLSCCANLQTISCDDGGGRDVENRIIIEGFLLKKASNTFKTWQRRWFRIQDNQLLYLKSFKNGPRVVINDLRRCTVHPFGTIRRRYCFQVVSPTKSYVLQADSEETRLAWTTAIESVAWASWPRPDDSEIWRHQGERAVPGSPDLERTRETYSVHRVEPPCNVDLGRKTNDMLVHNSSDSHKGVLNVKNIDTYVVHRASSPDQGVLDKWSVSTGNYVLHRDGSPCKDLENTTSGTHSVQKSSSPSNECFWNKYTVGEQLGKGGFGKVRAAVCNADGRQVAVKYVYKKPTMQYITIPGEAESHPAEVALMYMVSKSPRCEYVIEFLEWFDHPKYYMLVLEMPSPCMDLHQYLNKGPLTEDVAKAIMAQVVLAVCHCSKRGVLHRDIKTKNILVNSDSLQIKLIDFGCGDVLQTTPYREYEGTWINIPPELLVHNKYHGRPATVWSLGILQYTVLCGNIPFKNEHQIVNRDLSFTGDLSAACRHLISSCLDKNPENRLSLHKIMDHEWFGFQT